MKVDILEHLEDGTQRRVATFQWRDGELNCDNPVLWKHLMNSGGGVIIGARGKRYYPRDGIEYLKNLKYQFAGPYLFAQSLTESAEQELPAAPRLSASSTVTGGWPPAAAAAAPPAPPLEPEPERAPAKGSSRVSASLLRGKDGRKPAGYTEPRKTRDTAEGELSREVQERLCSGVFRLSSAMRGLAFSTARDEAEQLLQRLAELVQIDFAALTRAYESREEYLELRYQPPSRVNYAKMWDRIGRSWHSFLEVLESGDLAASLWPLFLVKEGLTVLPEHRAEWMQGSGFHATPGQSPAGIAAQDILLAWETAGLAAIRRKGLSATLLEEVYATAAEPFNQAVAHFQQADFGQSEADVRQALLIDPGSPDARLLLGDLMRRMDRVPEALSELQHAVELEHLSLRTTQGGPVRPEAYLRMARARVCIGRTLLGVGKVRDAAEQLEKGLENLDRLTRKTPPESLADAERLRLQEELSTIHRLLEPLYRALGETERADHHRKRIANP